MSLLSNLTFLFRNIPRALWSRSRNEATESESSELLGASRYTPSLSARYESFEQSFTTFKLCIFHVSCYYLAAVLCFSVFFEKWTVINSLYFATVLFTTVGFGDLSPSTFFGRMSVIILASYGIVLLGIFLGIAGQNMLEYQTQLWDRQRKSVRSKILKSVEQVAVEKRETINTNTRSSRTSDNDHPVELSLFQELRRIVALESPILLVVLAVGVVLGHFEGWTVFESVYFTVTTGTTIGFGDYHPSQPLIRLTCCFFLPLLVALLGQFLTKVASAYIKIQRRQAELKFLSRTMTIYDMQAMDENNDGEVQQYEFLAFMLVALNKVDKEEIAEIMSLFAKLDVNQSGSIDMKDIVINRSILFRNGSGVSIEA